MAENTDGSNSGSTPAPSAKASKPKVPYAAQDQSLANEISEADELLTLVETDTEVSAAMAERGYDKEELGKGRALQVAAQGAFNNRSKAMAELEAAKAAYGASDLATRATYAEFRETARVKFSAEVDRVALGLKGAVPRDLQKFETTAQASYTAASSVPYSAALAKAGFNPERITAELAAVRALPKLHAAFTQADGNASTATSLRDDACEKLRKWVNDYRRMAKLAAKKYPAIKSKVLA